MERYTTRGENGQAFVKSKDIAVFADAMNKFASYEDTGLTPDELTSALDSAAKLIATMRNNKKAALWLKKYGEEQSDG